MGPNEQERLIRLDDLSGLGTTRTLSSWKEASSGIQSVGPKRSDEFD